MPQYSHRIPEAAYDGQAEMVRWFDYWLRDGDQKSDIIQEPDITLYMRTSLTTGSYRYEPQWPIARRQIRRMFMCSGKRLVDRVEENGEDTADVDTLQYRQWIGYEAGDWWGVSFRDQRSFDEHSLIYDSDPVKETTEIAGFVNISLRVRHNVALRNGLDV